MPMKMAQVAAVGLAVAGAVRLLPRLGSGAEVLAESLLVFATPLVLIVVPGLIDFSEGDTFLGAPTVPTPPWMIAGFGWVLLLVLDAWAFGLF